MLFLDECVAAAILEGDLFKVRSAVQGGIYTQNVLRKNERVSCTKKKKVRKISS